LGDNFTNILKEQKRAVLVLRKIVFFRKKRIYHGNITKLAAAIVLIYIQLMFQTKRITLRAPEPEDIDILYRWENDAALWQFGNTINPLSRYALKMFIAESSNNIFETKQIRMMIVENEKNKPIGAVDLFDFEPFHLRVGVGIMIDSVNQRHGFAKEALELAKRYCFEWLHVHQIFAHITENNTPSMALFASCQFVETGILTDWIRSKDGFENVHVLQCKR